MARSLLALVFHVTSNLCLKVAEEARAEAECDGDPTAKWGYHRPPPNAPFAIAFAGEAISES